MSKISFDVLEKLTSKIGSGATPTGGQSAYKDEGISLIRSQNVLDMCFSKDGLAFIDEEQASKLDNVTVQEGDILLNITGDSIARVCKVPKEILPARVNQHVSIIRANERIDANYLLYYLIFRKDYLLTISRVGGTRNALTKEAIEKIEIRVDGNSEKVASVLSVLDDKIELNNKINVELEQMAKTLYDYWFVQFDFPNAKGKPYKSSGGKMVYNEVLKREVPQGWEVSTFSDWIAETKAGDWGKDSKEGNYTERVICIRGADINGINGKGEVKAPERFILKNNTSKALLANDFIIEISGGSPTQSTGRLALLSNKMFERFNAPVICSNFCKAISLKDEKYVFNFQQEWQRLYDANVFFGFEGKTSGIKNFLFDSFVSSYYVAVPKKEVVEKFYEFAYSLETKKQNNLIENQQLAALRDWLLPMLMNGQAKATGSHVQKELNIPNSKKGFAKQVLAGKIISLFKDDPHFTDIKFQKIQFLAEHIIQADLNLNYYYQAAGPYDNVFMHTIYNDLKRNKWYDYKNRKFTALEKQIKIDEYYQGYFGPAIGQLDKLFRLLENATEATSEIIATIYAVWNNFMIEKKSVSDKELTEAFYGWSQRKQQYTKAEVLKGLQWLRNNHLEPTGFGKLIKKAKGKK
jgi:type I restriction enzyme S subunit